MILKGTYRTYCGPAADRNHGQGVSHEVNLGWHPKAEDLLWRPDLQQPKRSQNGQWNVRYRNDVKRAGVERLQELIAHHAQWLRIRYAF
ncbi:hypothetical protein [Geodermatophilus sp. CPCC 205506]|uniref:hypothetical protein n=1 Tax=Geodermatophilus sp. CPCC 205506 TaxID=2936596 RepID=UPI003EF08ABA